MSRRGRVGAIGAAAVVLTTGLLIWAPADRHGEAFVAQQCSDNSTIERNWTHGDPNVEDLPEPSNPGIPPHNGYYYLNIKACDTSIYGVVYTAGDWAVQFQDASGTHVQPTQFHGTTALLVMNNATVGSVYRFRIANIGTSSVHDYAEFNSGQPGPDDQVSPVSKPSPEEEEPGEPPDALTCLLLPCP
jgi:hypothetical protein